MPTLYNPAETARLAVERQTCEWCHAKPGEPCLSSSGYERPPHQPRLASARIARDVLSVPCPLCAAGPGQRCETASHTSISATHAVRRAAAKRSA